MFALFRGGRPAELPPVAAPLPSESPAETAPSAREPHPMDDPAVLKLQAGLSAAASEAGTSIGWITHDSAQMAEQARLIAAASEELAATTSEVAARSQASAETAERARAGIAECAADMRLAGERMQVIQERASEIGGCLDGFAAAARRIEEMASAIAAISAQTNLLALNATIEAARAGEAGRGFAVVAGEVKALSAQTAKATDEIRARLGALQGELAAMQGAVDQSRTAVAAGSEVMARANHRVEAESAAVANAASEMRAMAAIMDQQIAATGEIASSVGNIASGIDKSRREIGDAIGRLDSLEGMSRTLLDRYAGDPLVLRLGRLPADCASWRRRLASALVGLLPVAEAAAVAVRPDPALPGPVHAALSAANARAEAMLGHIRAAAWGEAAGAFTDFEARIADTLKAAEAAIPTAAAA
jgi:hypothetical protein